MGGAVADGFGQGRTNWRHSIFMSFHIVSYVGIGRQTE